MNLKRKIYSLFHPQPKFDDPEAWRAWFTNTAMFDILNAAERINKAQKRIEQSRRKHAE